LSDRKAIHPEIGSIIRRRDQAYELLRMKQYDQVLEDMILILLELKPQDVSKYKEDIQEIRKLYFHFQYILGRTDNQTMALRLNEYKKRQEELWEHWHTLNKILWEGNYLLEEGYRGFFDPSGGRKSGERFEKK